MVLVQMVCTGEEMIGYDSHARQTKGAATRWIVRVTVTKIKEGKEWKLVLNR